MQNGTKSGYGHEKLKSQHQVLDKNLSPYIRKQLVFFCFFHQEKILPGLGMRKDCVSLEQPDFFCLT